MLFKYAAPLAIAGLVAASPVAKRNNGGKSGSSSSSSSAASSTIDDATILQYALTLEHLEAAFYREGLDMYNAGAFEGAGFPDFVRQRFTEIASHERTHVETLTAGLTAAGANPVKECEYNFGVTGPQSFLALAQVLESVGVSAYLGAAPSITSDAYLALAGSILVVETQHQSWARAAADNLDAFPTPFAPYLDFNQVYSLAAPFITSCPADNVALPFKSFPALTVTSSGPYAVGGSVTVDVPNLKGNLYAAFVSAVGANFVPVKAGQSATVKIPDGVAGQSYLIITYGPSLTDKSTAAGPAIVEVAVPAQNFDYSGSANESD